MEAIFWFGLFCLLIFSIIDLRTRKLDNQLILAFLIFGLLIYQYPKHNLLATLLGMLLMAILTITLWNFKAIGGADAKLLIALVPYLSFFGIANMLATLFQFLIEFGLIGGIYGFSYIKLYKEHGKIPFIPIITLVYVVSWIFSI